MKELTFRKGTQLIPISDSASDLLSQPNIILKLDNSLDGANRYIEITRKPFDLDLTNRISGFLNLPEADFPEEIAGMLHAIEEYADSQLLNKDIVDIEIDNHRARYYVTETPVNSILGDSLITQILGRGSKLDLLYADQQRNFPQTGALEMNTASVAVYGDDDFQEAKEKVNYRKYLAISLDDNSVSVVELNDRENIGNVRSMQHLRNEDISILKPKVLIKEFGRTILESDFDLGYPSHLTQVVNNGNLQLRFKVSRQLLASLLPSVFQRIREMHRDNIIHCDIKPQNLLCLKEGITAIDPISVGKGEVSPGMTHNFCAPEQVLSLPVSYGTDIYNLGLIVLMIVDGVLYGKTSNYIIPTGNKQVRNINMLVGPEVYIDFEYANVMHKEGISHWQSFLKRCLAFDPDERFSDIDGFENEYQRLLRSFPLKNDIEFQPHFGRLSLVETGNKFEAAWFV